MKDLKKVNMKIKIKIPLVFFFFISFLISANAQIDSSPIINKVYTSPKLKAFELKSDSLVALNITPSLTKQNYQGFYQDCLGVFCKFENEILKSANVPIRFRLGSTEYVDQLEQKIPSYKDVNTFKKN